MYKIVNTPIKIGEKVIRNRTVSSPVSINKANEKGQVTENIISFFSNLAKHDLGMVTIGAVSVSEEGTDTKNGMRIGQDMHFEGLSKLASKIKKNGAAACIQLFHVGAQGNSHLSNKRVVGPSKYIVPDIGIEAEVLTIEEIKNIEDDFVKGIIQADKAGFDFIEIHMAHGYLLHEFLSPHMNKRKDEYGGSEENRFKIITNILEKLKKQKIMNNLGARLTGDDFHKDGLNIDKIKNLVKYLDQNNFCYYSVTAGIYETAKQKYIHMKEGSYWKYSKQLKKITNTPVIAQGNITSLQEGDKIILNKQGDMIGMAQSLIADPALVTKSLNNKKKEVFNCLAHVKIGSCHRCRYVKRKDHDFDCVTPAAWRPVESKNTDLDRKKDIDFWRKTINILKEQERSNRKIN